MQYCKQDLVFDSVDGALATVLLVHGAGADLSSDYLVDLANRLNEQQFNVVRFNFPYMVLRQHDGKRRPPDRMPKLVDAMQQVISLVDDKLPLFVLGKSMGSRVAVTVCEQESIALRGVACIGYPFHPQKKPDKLRLEPLQKTTKPVLILQGERDPLGNKEEVISYELSDKSNIVFFEDGDHDLKPRVKSGFKLEQHVSRAINEFVRFVDEHS